MHMQAAQTHSPPPPNRLMFDCFLGRHAPKIYALSAELLSLWERVGADALVTMRQIWVMMCDVCDDESDVRERRREV